jgi:hypothetical protein
MCKQKAQQMNGEWQILRSTPIGEDDAGPSSFFNALILAPEACEMASLMAGRIRSNLWIRTPTSRFNH